MQNSITRENFLEVRLMINQRSLSLRIGYFSVIGKHANIPPPSRKLSNHVGTLTEQLDFPDPRSLHAPNNLFGEGLALSGPQ